MENKIPKAATFLFLAKKFTNQIHGHACTKAGFIYKYFICMKEQNVECTNAFLNLDIVKLPRRTGG
jgi:hypothetical protein